MSTDRGAGGPGGRQEIFPTVATVPGPQDAMGSTAGGPSERNKRGEGQAGEGPKWEGRDDDQKSDFTRLLPPPKRWRRYAQQQRGRIKAIRGNDPGQWTRGRAGFEGEYGLSIYQVIMICTSTEYPSYHVLLSIKWLPLVPNGDAAEI